MASVMLRMKRAARDRLEADRRKRIATAELQEWVRRALREEGLPVREVERASGLTRAEIDDLLTGRLV